MNTIDDDHKLHDRQVRAVTSAAAKLLAHLGPAGFTPEAIFEGAVRGGAVALLAGSPATAGDVADLLETVGEEFRHLDKPRLRVVQ